MRADCAGFDGGEAADRGYDTVNGREGFGDHLAVSQDHRGVGKAAGGVTGSDRSRFCCDLADLAPEDVHVADTDDTEGEDSFGGVSKVEINSTGEAPL